MFDIGRHIIAKKGYDKPNNYQDVIQILSQNDVISQTFSESLRGMAGYRNRLVHGYAMVSPSEIFYTRKLYLFTFVKGLRITLLKCAR